MLVGGARLRTCRFAAARAGYSCGLVLFLLLFGSRALQNAIAEGDTRTISLHHVHTDEDITITFKRDGRYDEAALEKLNWFLRDWRREEQTRMDPHLIDLIWEVQRETGSHEPVWVVCGYRSPQTNAMLRHRSRGVARFSQHMLGHAMDFYIPGVPLEQLRVVGLRLQRGGVGFYPTSGSPFVHMDTGGVRHWPRMTREQLVKVFPDGRTVHIPTDGHPLPGYAIALAEIKKHGGTPSEMSIEAARSAGLSVEVASAEHRGINPFLKLFGLGKSDDDEDADVAAPVTTAADTPPAVPLRTRAKAVVVAAIERAEDKLAAGKAKLATVASKAHVITRAEAATLPASARLPEAATRVAAVTPNEIIQARGYWEGPSDGMIAAPPAAASANPLAAVAPRRAEVASADATGSVGPFSADDRVPAQLALAYAAQPEREEATRAAPAPAPAPRATLSRALAVQTTGQNDMTIAVKRVGGRPASAILTIANKGSPALRDGAPIDDPWLRAIVLSPSVHHFLTTAAFGDRDFRSLAVQMIKPANSVMMTFASEPNPGLEHDHFSGSAIVFVSTVTYPMHTASLR